MSRKTKLRRDAADAARTSPATRHDDTDPHGFWDRANLDRAANDDAFAHVIDMARDEPDERETLVYMGSVTEVNGAELVALAGWAEGKACRACRRKMVSDRDAALLKHEECRTAYRVSGMLHRYQ